MKTYPSTLVKRHKTSREEKQETLDPICRIKHCDIETIPLVKENIDLKNKDKEKQERRKSKKLIKLYTKA